MQIRDKAELQTMTPVVENVVQVTACTKVIMMKSTIGHPIRVRLDVIGIGGSRLFM
jgi:hypothetical protein